MTTEINFDSPSDKVRGNQPDAYRGSTQPHFLEQWRAAMDLQHLDKSVEIPHSIEPANSSRIIARPVRENKGVKHVGESIQRLSEGVRSNGRRGRRRKLACDDTVGGGHKILHRRVAPLRRPHPVHL